MRNNLLHGKYAPPLVSESCLMFACSDVAGTFCFVFSGIDFTGSLVGLGGVGTVCGQVSGAVNMVSSNIFLQIAVRGVF